MSKAGVLAGALFAAIGAAPAMAQTLEETIGFALEANPVLEAERAAARAAYAGIDIARAPTLPTVSIDSSYQRQDVQRTSAFNQITGTQSTSNLDLDTLDVSLNVTQSLYEGFRNRARIAEASSDAAAADAEVGSVQQSLIITAVTAHADVIRDEAVLAFQRASVAALEEQVRGAQRRFELRDATVTDVAQAEARRANADARIASVRAQLLSSRARYQQVTGQPAGSLLPLPSLTGVPTSLTDAVEMAFETSPEIAAAEARAKASSNAVGAAKAAYAPSVSAFARAGYLEDQTFAGDSREDVSVGLRARIPLYQGGAARAGVQAARDIAQRDAFLVAQTRRDLQARVTTEWESLEAARGSLAAVETQTEAAQRAFDSIQEEALNGVRTLIEVLDAERELLDAQIALASTQRDLHVAEWRLLATLGQADTARISAS